MVKLDHFELDHWIATRGKSARYNLAKSNCLPISIEDVEALPGEAAASDALASIRSRPLDYGHGSEDLRTKIAKMYSDDLPHEQVLTAPGGSLANFLVFYALVGPGDHVVVQHPTYPQLHGVPVSLGAEVSFWRAKEEAGWALDMDELKSLTRPNTKLIVLCNPQNPLGTVIHRPIMEEILKFSSERSITVFCDEIYRPLYYPTASSAEQIPPSIISLGYPNTVATCGLSKSYSLAGLRLGWLVSPNPEIVSLCANARSYCLISTSQLDEHIAAYALEPKRAASIVGENISRANRNRESVQSFINQHSAMCSWVPPTGASLGFIKFTRSGVLIDDLAMCKILHENEGVLLVPGSIGFGKEFSGYVRIGLGMDTQVIKDGLDVVAKFIQHHYEDIPLAAA